MTPTRPWRLEVLGTSRLIRPDGAALRPEKVALALLTYLALEGPTPRSRLAALLWPETEPGAARNNLVHLLRRVARTCGEDLLRAGDTLSLAPGVEVDARTLLEAEGTGGDGDDSFGELLDGVEFDERPDLADWLLAWRETFAARREGRLQARLARAEGNGDLVGALAAATRLLDLDPLSEDAYREAMRLHYRLGDRAAALRTYHRCREVLGRELGVEPGAATTRLAGEIERGEDVMGPPTAARPALPLAVRRPPVLVGRAQAWAQMESAWEKGQIIYLTGDPGVGKTRLAQDFVASRGRALYLPGHPGSRDVPFAAAAHNARARLAASPGVELPAWVRRELSRVLPEFRKGAPPAPIDSEQARLNYFLAHLEVVRLTGSGYAGVITDDVQHYDEASVDLGAFFLTQGSRAGAADDVPRHILIYRRGTLPPVTQARQDALVKAGRAVRIDLGPLGEAAVAELLGEVFGEAAPVPLPTLARDLHGLTGGNPQFLLEALRHMFQTGDFTVGDALRVHARGVTSLTGERLAGLSAPALQAARAAAVLGEDPPLELVAEVLRVSLFDLAGAWEELEGAQVVHGERFSHALVREAVLDGTPPGVRTLLERSAARTLPGHGAHPGRVARHWLNAGDLRQAAVWLMRAGEAAAGTSRHVEAADFYASALGAYREVGDAEGERSALLAQEAAQGRGQAG
ncbi:BTAD domain-containing putative transcriptional regulator [Deinococcus aetherius]|nr:BTAD domain-containing putative transcriptional regulator [Deinococcus aetherius]